MRGKDTLKRVAYRSGLLSAIHRVRNRRSLTVVMFHRVLAPDDPRWACAEPGYTVSDTLFDECLTFFKRHYNVVDLQTVLAAASNAGRLPERPLLITFDDGWADNAEYAVPLLRRHGLSAVVFVVSSAVGRHAPLWHDLVLAAWRTGRLDAETFAALWERAGNDVPAPHDPVRAANVRELVQRLKRLTEEERATATARLARELTTGSPAHMVSADQLNQLCGTRVAIGCHGLRHTSLTEVADPVGELREARQALALAMNHRSDRGLDTMSFPNGQYSAESIRAAQAAGFRLMFTSDPFLNAASRRKETVGRNLLGRIEVPAHEVSAADGSLRPELLALWLFTRPSAPALRQPA